MTSTQRSAVDRLAALTFKNKDVPMSVLQNLIKHEHQRIALAYHESGHAVVGVLHGATLCDAVITDGDRVGDGFSHPTGETSFDDLPEGHAAQIAYSGPYAQARGVAKRRPNLRELHAAFDGAGRVDQDQLCASGERAAGADVVPLLLRCWPAVATIARQLFDGGCVGHADVCKALSIPVADNGPWRSAILAGSAPNSFTIVRPVG